MINKNGGVNWSEVNGKDGAVDWQRANNPDNEPTLQSRDLQPADTSPALQGSGVRHSDNTEGYQRRSAVEAYNIANGEPRQETEEEKKKRLRKEKRERLMSNVSDAFNFVNSLSNLYFTTRGALNAYKPSDKSKTEQTMARQQAMQRAVEKARQDYADGLIKAQALDDEWRDKLNARKAAKDKADADGARKAEEAKLNLDKFEWAKDKDLWSRGYKEGRAKAKDDLDNRKQNENERHNKASESNTAARIRKSGSGDKYYGTIAGVPYRTKADYDTAKAELAKANNIPTERQETSPIPSVQPYTDYTKRDNGEVVNDINKAEAAKKKSSSNSGSTNSAKGGVSLRK